MLFALVVAPPVESVHAASRLLLGVKDCAHRVYMEGDVCYCNVRVGGLLCPLVGLVFRHPRSETARVTLKVETSQKRGSGPVSVQVNISSRFVVGKWPSGRSRYPIMSRLSRILRV